MENETPHIVLANHTQVGALLFRAFRNWQLLADYFAFVLAHALCHCGASRSTTGHGERRIEICSKEEV
jgi:hypothetical protein